MSETRGRRGAPRVPTHAFARPRLLERLSAWSDVTVVRGPVGAGKTTLIAAWAASSDAALLWCEPEAGRLPLSDIEAFAAAGEGVLVIDAGERVDPEHLERLGRLIDRHPELRTVVATSSARTARELAAASDAGLGVIEPAELRVTLEELRDAGLLDDDDARREVLRRSEGLAIAVRAELDDALGLASGAGERLRRRLIGELGEDPGRREALLRVSLLPRVDRAILEAWALPEDLPGYLEDAGVAEWDGDWLRMHLFVRTALAEDVERDVPASERRRLAAVAVRVSLISRDPLQALRTALDLEDLPLATEIVLANMIELLESRDASYEVLTRVPASRLRGYPALTVMLVLLSNMDPSTRPRALQLLAVESLFQRLHPSRGLHRERVVYRAFEAAALRLTPFSGRALPLIRRAAEDFSTLTEHDFGALGRMGPMLQVHLGIGAFYLRDLGLARWCFEIAEAKHLEAGRADRVDPLSLRAGLAALSGELPLARRLLAEADAAEWPAGWRDSSPADFFNLGMAVVALEDGDPHAAERHLAAAGPIVEIIEHWTLYALVRARRDRLAGEADVGLVRLQRLREQRGSAPGTPMSRSFLDAAEAELNLAAGDAHAARRIAARSARHSASCRLSLARAELALDRSSAAATHAQRVLNAPHPTPRNRVEAELVLACAALRAGHHRDSEAVARRIAELIRTTGLRAPLRTVAARDRDALSAALFRAGLAQSIVSLVGGEAIPADEAAPVATLTPREQAVLEVLAETGALDEIAARLYVSRNTVKSQLSNVYRKLGVSSREAALTRAAVLGLLDQPTG